MVLALCRLAVMCPLNLRHPCSVSASLNILWVKAIQKKKWQDGSVTFPCFVDFKYTHFGTWSFSLPRAFLGLLILHSLPAPSPVQVGENSRKFWDQTHLDLSLWNWQFVWHDCLKVKECFVSFHSFNLFSNVDEIPTAAPWRRQRYFPLPTKAFHYDHRRKL